jgi:hypothetical protein
VGKTPAELMSTLAASVVFTSSFEDNEAATWSESVLADFPATSFYHNNWGSTAPRTGAKAYAISNHAYGSIFSNFVPVQAGGQYQLSGYVRGGFDPAASTGSWELRAAFYDSNNNPQGFALAAKEPAANLPATWSQKGGTITIPAGVSKLRVVLYNYLIDQERPEH